MGVWVDSELCNGCRRCLKVCPYDAVAMRGEKAVILEHCPACGACIEVCRQGAVKTDVVPRTIPDFSDYRGVWVLAETLAGELNPVSLELLGEAQKLARTLKQEVGVILPGRDISDLAPLLARFGAVKICLAADEALEPYRVEIYTEIVAEIVTEFKPGILLIGATSRGRELAPRLARRLKVGLTADCTALTIDPDEKILLQTRPAFGGNIMATIASRYSRPQMATVRPGVMQPGECEGNRAEIINHTVKIPDTPAIAAAQVLEVVREARRKVRLGEAKVIVAGGRGTGGETGFNLVEKLAAEFGGEVAGTRIAVEEGWVPVERQVGQTGQTVRPELYIACGISGAVQHRAGMQNSRYIIAINRDPGAPIFAVADWGIVGDLHQVIPEILNQMDGDKP